MRRLRWMMRQLLWSVGLSMLALGGCAMSEPHGTPAAVTTPADGEVTAVAASVVYPAGPWEREAGDTLNGKPMQTRAFATQPDGEGKWTILVRQRVSEQVAWTDVQELVLSRNEAGAVQLHELTTYARGTRAVFTPGLVLCPAEVAGVKHEATAAVQSTGLDGKSDKRSGTATATAVVTGVIDDGARVVALTLMMKLGPATITRSATFTVPAGAATPSSERSELVVKGGPFVIQREVRERGQPIAR